MGHYDDCYEYDRQNPNWRERFSKKEAERAKKQEEEFEKLYKEREELADYYRRVLVH